MSNMTLELKTQYGSLVNDGAIFNHRNGTDDIEEEYKMAAEVAIGSAIFVALAIILALIGKWLKRNIPGREQHPESSRRPSTNSLDRLIEHRLQDCPPPYSVDGDKPPSYEDSFNDYTTPLDQTAGTNSSGGNSGRFSESSVQMQRSTALRNQVNVFSYDNEAFDGAGDQLSGRASSSSLGIRTISSELDASQTTQYDQDDHFFSVHL